jgi:hypothetical protein
MADATRNLNSRQGNSGQGNGEKGSTNAILKNMPDPMIPMTYFFVLTSIYCVISLYTFDDMNKMIVKSCYMLLVVMGEYFINLNLSEAMCGGIQWNAALMATLIPWVMIFLVIQVFLYMFPGWLTPFANTFGYGIVKIMGLTDLMDKILEPPALPQNESNVTGNQIASALENIRLDKSLIVNELHSEKSKFDEDVNKLINGKIIKSTTTEKDKEELYGYITQKNTIAEYIWNLLTGFLVTSVTYNNIVNTTCVKSVDVMKKQYSEYEIKVNNAAIEKNLKTAQELVYTNGSP